MGYWGSKWHWFIKFLKNLMQNPCQEIGNWNYVVALLDDSILFDKKQTPLCRQRSKLWVFFSSSHVQVWEWDHKEGWAPKNWCFWIVVLEKTLERVSWRDPWTAKEIKPVNPKRNQPWIFIGRTCWCSSILATWCEELTHWKRPWCWERLKAKGKGAGRGWDG